MEHPLFQVGLMLGNEPVEAHWQALLTVHELWPDLQFAASDVDNLSGGVWLVPVPHGEQAELLASGLTRSLDVYGVGRVSVEIYTT